jgi:hypothetical protein
MGSSIRLIFQFDSGDRIAVKTNMVAMGEDIQLDVAEELW